MWLKPLAMFGSLDDVPLELCELITSRLQPGALRSLCAASQIFGQQPTSQLVTRLNIALPSLSCMHQQQRQDRLSCVTSVSLTGASVQPDSVPGCSHLTQLVSFTSRLVPSMTQLTKLTLKEVHPSCVFATVACLPTSCPQLTSLSLDVITWGKQRCDLNLAGLWPTLAALPLLRHLEVDVLCRMPISPTVHYRGDAGDAVSGIGVLTQLQTLCVGEAHVRMSDLQQLTGLTQLEMCQVAEQSLSGGATDDGPPVSVETPLLSRLQTLRLRSGYLTCDALVHHFRACAALTSLHSVSSQGGNLPDTLPACAGLARLDLPSWQVVAAALSVAMPRLQQLYCCSLVMPAAESRVAFPHIRAVACGFASPQHANGGARLPSQPLAQTLPNLTALKYLRAESEELQGELFPDTPAGQLHHCRTVSLPQCVPLLLGRCAPLIEALSIAKNWGDWSGHTAPLAEQLHGLLGGGLGARLRCVELSHQDTDDNSLTVMAANWPGVEEVTLRGQHSHRWRHDIYKVSDVGLAALCRLPRLRRVRLLRCSAITPAGVAVLARRWSVEVIEVGDCPRVSAADVAWVEANLGRPQLEFRHLPAAEKEPSEWDWLLHGTSG